MAGRLLRKYASAGLATFGAVVLSGCNTPSQAAYERQVATAVQPGMLANQAEIALQRRGYACLRQNGARADECTRMSADKIIATCIQRVVLHYDQAEVHVERAETRPIVCVGP